MHINSEQFCLPLTAVVISAKRCIAQNEPPGQGYRGCSEEQHEGSTKLVQNSVIARKLMGCSCIKASSTEGSALKAHRLCSQRLEGLQMLCCSGAQLFFLFPQQLRLPDCKDTLLYRAGIFFSHPARASAADSQ